MLKLHSTTKAPKLTTLSAQPTKSTNKSTRHSKIPSKRIIHHVSKRTIVRQGRAGTPEFVQETNSGRMRHMDAFNPTKIAYPTGDISEFELSGPSSRTHQQMKKQFRFGHSQNRQMEPEEEQEFEKQQFKEDYKHQRRLEKELEQAEAQYGKKKSLFGNMDMKKLIEDDQSFMKDPTRSSGKHLLGAVGDLNTREGTKLRLERQQIDKERIDLSSLEVQPYLENLKGAIIHHDLEQIVASIGGILRFGGRADIFDAKVDNEETIIHKITQNNDKHRKEYRVMYDNVRALLEVIQYDLESISRTLNQSSNVNKLHCTINTLMHLMAVYNVVPIPLNDPHLKTHHCSIDEIAQKIVQRSEDLDIMDKGPDIYQDRLKHPPIKVISPLLGAIYMMILKRSGFTTGLVHTPMVGLVFATPPVSRQNVGTQNPDIASRLQQNSPYWFINNLVTDHSQQYRKTNLKLTPVDCKGFCTPSLAENKTPDQLAEEFTCSCLTQSEVGYGGNFLYIDFLVGKIGQIPYFYKANNSIDALATQNLDLSSDITHSKQDKFNWLLPYPIYSYKTLAMRLIYEPIFASDITNQLGLSLELSANHLSSHLDNDSWKPKKVEVEYQEFEPGSSSEDVNALENDAEFQEFLREHDHNPKL